jgi:hypothetical protein
MTKDQLMRQHKKHYLVAYCESPQSTARSDIDIPVVHPITS